MAKKQLTFEESLKRLETIAREIEEGKIGLEDAITRYEEGMKLVQRCRSILTTAEQKIKKLQPTEDGGLTTTDVEMADPSTSANDDE
jgi:exodeoxyribonuclease VII small subunit